MGVHDGRRPDGDANPDSLALGYTHGIAHPQSDPDGHGNADSNADGFPDGHAQPDAGTDDGAHPGPTGGWMVDPVRCPSLFKGRFNKKESAGTEGVNPSIPGGKKSWKEGRDIPPRSGFILSAIF